MRALTIVVVLAAVSCCLVVSEGSSNPFRVAVIGSGVSGAASSYFLHTLLETKRSPSDAHSRPLKIDVYEKSDTVGGRVQNIVVDGLATEMGGSIFLDRNEYVMHFVKTLGLDAVKASEQPFRIGVWDQDHKGFSFVQSRWKLVSLLKMMSRYGLFNVLKLRSETLGLLEKWMKIYEIQEKGMAFEEVDEFFKYLGLYQFTQETFNQTCPEPLRSSDLIRELGYGVTLINYNQQIEHMSSLAAYISLSTLASGAPLFKVKNGNNQMIKGLFDRAHAKVHTKSAVKKISLVSKSPVKYSITVEGSETPAIYDAVLIATPLELTDIDFDESIGIKPSQFPQRAYQVTHNTIVKGTPNPAYWNVSSVDEMPDIVMFARAHPVRTQLSSFATWLIYPDGQRLVKIFSPEEVPDSLLDKMFLSHSEVHRLPWKAYTKFAPPEKFPPTVLSPRLYYVSAIENAGSALEMMSVWARNVAQLLVQSILDDESSHVNSPSGGASREEL